MKEFAKVHVSGPLAMYATGVAAELTAQGYADLSVRNQLQVVAHFSRWLEAKGIEAQGLTRQWVERYLRVRRRTRTCWRTIHGLTPLLTFLGHAAIVEVDPPADSDVIARYRASLVERSLSAGGQRVYMDVARDFLGDRNPARLTPGDVTRFVHQARPCNASLLSALRSALRCLFLFDEATSS